VDLPLLPFDLCTTTTGVRWRLGFPCSHRCLPEVVLLSVDWRRLGDQGERQGIARGTGRAFELRKIIYMRNSFLFFYPSTSTFIYSFFLIHLHRESFLILYFFPHPSTSCARWQRNTILHQKSFLILFFFRTLPPPRLYIISLFYICIWNHFLFFIFSPFHLLLRSTRYCKGRGGPTERRLSHETVVLLSFFLVVGDLSQSLNHLTSRKARIVFFFGQSQHI
jgi:hypothetical protein